MNLNWQVLNRASRILINGETMGYYMKKPTCPRCGATVKYVIWEKGATGMLSAISNSFSRKKMLIDNVSE